MASARLRCLHVLAVIGCASAWCAGVAHASPDSIKVGTLTLTLCNTDYTGYCGSIQRPIDPGDGVTGTITVGFEYYPRSDATKARLGTILPQEVGQSGTRGCGKRFRLHARHRATLRQRSVSWKHQLRTEGPSGAKRCRSLRCTPRNWRRSRREPAINLRRTRRRGRMPYHSGRPNSERIQHLGQDLCIVAPSSGRHMKGMIRALQQRQRRQGAELCD
jgi:hypothetical protein